jgi:hypothetical protein
MPGRKFDGGKLEYGLVPPFALREVVKVLTFVFRSMKEITGKKYQILSVDILMPCNVMCGHGKKEKVLILNLVYITWHTLCAA